MHQVFATRRTSVAGPFPEASGSMRFAWSMWRYEWRYEFSLPQLHGELPNSLGELDQWQWPTVTWEARPDPGPNP